MVSRRTIESEGKLAESGISELGQHSHGFSCRFEQLVLHCFKGAAIATGVA